MSDRIEITLGTMLPQSGARVIARSAGAMLLVLLILWPTPALAHEDAAMAGGFTTGFRHPLSGIDHALAMISVGLWGAFLGRPLIIVLPTLFPVMMALGGGLGMAGVPVPPVEAGIALSVLVLGLMVAFAVRAPVPVACAIVAVFALFHGYAHGLEAPSRVDPVGYSTGFVLSTGLLHLAGIAIGTLLLLPRGAIAVRAAGAGIALSGSWFLAGALSR